MPPGTVTYQGHPVESREPSKTGTPGEDAPKEKEPVTMVSTIIKTGSTILEQNVEADGKQHQIWHISGLRIVSLPGSSKPAVCTDYRGRDIFSINFAATDFDGLDWLSPITYAGIVKYQANDCIVFRGTLSPLSERDQVNELAFIQESRALGIKIADPIKVPALAYIDLQSQLPVLAIFGKEKRIYQYGAPPRPSDRTSGIGRPSKGIRGAAQSAFCSPFERVLTNSCESD